MEADIPISHVSHFEVQAYACWAGKRLLTEGEWESQAQTQSVASNPLDSNMSGDDSRWTQFEIEFR